MIKIKNIIQKVVIKEKQQLKKQIVFMMPWLYYKQMDKHFNYVIRVITMRVPYLKDTLPIKKAARTKKDFESIFNHAKTGTLFK